MFISKLSYSQKLRTFFNVKFNVQGSVHRKYIPLDILPRCNITQVIYFWKTALHVLGCICGICDVCHRLVQFPHHTQTSSNSPTVEARNSNG